MSVTIEDLVRAYYETLGDGTFDGDRLRAILAPQLAFEGPLAGQRVGAEMFIKGVTGFAETMKGQTMLHQLHAGDEAAVLYDAEMPGGSVRFAEFFRAADGKIQSLRLLFDATAYRARGGR
jgi:ketosteroid isomerase-like protein